MSSKNTLRSLSIPLDNNKMVLLAFELDKDGIWVCHMTDKNLDSIQKVIDTGIIPKDAITLSEIGPEDNTREYVELWKGDIDGPSIDTGLI